jgi:hypothetical protein
MLLFEQYELMVPAYRLQALLFEDCENLSRSILVA